jgi:hypothetical protein
MPKRFDDRADEAGTLQRRFGEAHMEILFDAKFTPNGLEILFTPMIAIHIATFVRRKGGYVMKRALICGMGVVALMAGGRTFMHRPAPPG